MSDVLRLYTAAWLSPRGGSSWLAGNFLACGMAVIFGIPNLRAVMFLGLLYGLYHVVVQSFTIMKRPTSGYDDMHRFEADKLRFFLANAHRLLLVTSFLCSDLLLWVLWPRVPGTF